jgi:uncharacterized protein YdaU (DUF1376 family)
LHYYHFNIADYRKDTQHLSPIEHYIYRELMDWYYLDESPIPKITQVVSRRLRLVSENNQTLLDVLQEFFTETENGWVHARIEREITAYQSRAEAARVNGSKGGRPVKPRKTQPVNLANPEKPKAKLTSNQEPVTNITTTTTRPSVSDVAAYVETREIKINPQSFVDYYSANGWKVGRNSMKDWKAAVRTWEKNQHGNIRGTTGQSGHAKPNPQPTVADNLRAKLAAMQ